MNRFIKTVPICLFAVLLIGLAYSPGLKGPFVFDDYPNIINNPDIKLDSLSVKGLWDASFEGVTGGVKRPLSVATLAFNFSVFGGDAYYFKLINLVIHIVSFLAASFFIVQLLRLFTDTHQSSTRIQMTGVLLGLIWALHPLNLTGVLYVIQRMTSLSALFVFLSLGLYCRAKFSDARLKLYVLALCSFLLGVLSKENALMTFFYIVLIEIALVFKDGKITGFQRYLFSCAACATLVLCIFIYTTSDIYLNYSGRGFTLSERLLTELRVIFDYLRLSLLPDISQMSLYHDDIAVSKSLFDPVATALSLLAHAVVIISAFLVGTRNPLFLFGILFFYMGHMMEGTIFPLELMHEHRNYLPLAGLLIAVYGVTGSIHISKQAGLALIVGVLSTLSVLTLVRSQEWSSFGRMSVAMADRQPTSTRAQLAAGNFFYIGAMQATIPERKEYFLRQSEHYLKNAIHADGSSILGLVGYVFLFELEGKKLHEAFLSEFHARISNNKLSSQDKRGFIELLVCFTSQRCTLNLAVILPLLDVFIKNSAMDRSTLEQALLLNAQLRASL